MKRIYYYFCTMVLVALVTALASCSSQDDFPYTPVRPSDSTVTTGDGTYTIIFYGCSDSVLDESLQSNLWQLLTNGKKDRVNFRGLVKYSPTMQQTAKAENIDLSGVRIVSYADTLDENYVTGTKAYDNNYRLDNPQHLADFITETKRLMPADNYILVLWDHGDVFGLNEKAVQSSYGSTRAMLSDPHTGKTFSTYELEEALRLSGTKMKLVYFDLCLMGMVESYTQIKDYTEYGMGAVNVTPGYGGNYLKLVNSLQYNDTFEEAMKEYVPAAVSSWRVNGSPGDLGCFNLAYIDQLNYALKNVAADLTDLVNYYKKKGAFDKTYTLLNDDARDGLIMLQKSEYTVENEYYSLYGKVMPIQGVDNPVQSTDISTTLGRLIRLTPRMTYYSDQVDGIFDQMTVASSFNNMPSYVEKMSMGITWPTYEYMKSKNKKDDYVGNLRRSAFNKATGWVDFLESPISKYLVTSFRSVLENKPGLYAYLTNYDDASYGYYQWTVSIEASSESQDSVKIEEIETDFNNALAEQKLPIYHVSQGLLADIEANVKSAELKSKTITVTVQLAEENYNMPGDIGKPTSYSRTIKQQ